MGKGKQARQSKESQSASSSGSFVKSSAGSKKSNLGETPLRAPDLPKKEVQDLNLPGKQRPSLMIPKSNILVEKSVKPKDNNKSATPSTAFTGAGHKIQEMSDEAQMKLAIEASLSQISSVPPSRIVEKISPSKSSIPASSETVKSNSTSWKDYLGPKVDGQKPLQFLIHFPDGSKVVVSFPVASKVKALVLFLAEGYNLGPSTSYELISTFPTKKIFSSSSPTLDEMATLESAGFKHRDTLYLHMKK